MRPRRQVWAIVVAMVLAAAPLTLLAGAFTMAGLNHAFGPPAGGEALQGKAFAAFLFGGPVGLLAGGALVGWAGHRMARRAGSLAIAVTLAALALASARALVELGVTN